MGAWIWIWIRIRTIDTHNFSNWRIRTWVTDRQARTRDRTRIKIEIPNGFWWKWIKGNRLVLFGHRNRLGQRQGRGVTGASRLVGSYIRTTRSNDTYFVKVTVTTAVNCGYFQVVPGFLEITGINPHIIQESAEVGGAHFTQGNIGCCGSSNGVRATGDRSGIVRSVHIDFGLTHCSCIGQGDDHLVPCVVCEIGRTQNITITIIYLKLSVTFQG